MGRRRKAAAAKKKKAVMVSLLKRENAGKVTQPYRIMEDLVERFHPHLVDAKIAIAWNVGPERDDADGRKVLGKVKKGSDLDRELAPFDFVITLSHSAWNKSGFTEREMYALIDHQLCKCAVSKGKDGETKIDEKNRVVFRIRKPDVVEFKEVVSRWGLHTTDLEEFAKAAEESKSRPMLNQFNEPAEKGASRRKKVTSEVNETSDGSEKSVGVNGKGFSATMGPDWVESNNPQRAAQIRERAEILNNGAPGCLEPKASGEAHDAGMAAFKTRNNLEDCPHEPGPTQDDWIRGFLRAELLERYEPEHAAAS